MPAPDFSRPAFITQPVSTQSAGGLSKLLRLAWQLVQYTPATKYTGPVADPTASEWLMKNSLEVGFKLLFGVIVDAVTYVNCYKVQFENTGPTIWCTPLTSLSVQPMGQKQILQLQPGTKVIVAIHTTDFYGYIVGVVPTFISSPTHAMPDFISQAGRSGLLVEAAHKYPFGLSSASFLPDFSSGGPFDRTTMGEYGCIAETGVGYFADSYMTYLRADEETGVWAFYNDQMLRLAGHNLQIRTTGSEQEDLDKHGQYDSVTGHTPYYWEALGAFEFPTTVCREIDADKWQRDPECQQYAAREPCNDHQVPWFRLRDFYGYVGQAHKRVLCLPPPCPPLSSPEPTGTCDDGKDCGNINLLQDQRVFPGVYDENLALTGRKVTRTAHELIIAKYPLIPVPKQVLRPEDPNGNNPDNYLATGNQGTGPSHLVVGEIDVPSGDNPLLITATAFMDTNAFSFEWVGNHPFHYYDLDYFTPNQSELGISDFCAAPSIPPPKFEELVCYQYLERPDPITLTVDHRYGNVSYYPNNSYIGLLADGGVVVGDGFGAELRMTAGSGWLTAPGDLNVEVGRNLNVLAGYDICMRAKNCVDISATNQDVRIKAKERLWMVASGECGGILIESMATDPYCDFTTEPDFPTLGGILIKADNSLITQRSRNMCIKLTEADDDSDADNNVLIFDTGWAGRIRTRARYTETFLTNDGGAMNFWVNASTDEVESASEQWRDVVTFCQKVRIDDGVLIDGCLAVNSSILILDGHIASSNTNGFGGAVGNLGDVTSLEAEFAALDARCSTDLPTTGESELGTLDERQEDMCCNGTFRFRNTAQYRTEDWTFFETRWQQLARQGGVSVSAWTEDPVNSTYPYPGKEKWFDEATYRQVDLSLWDPSTGIAADRGAAYESPTFSTPASVIPDGNYMVII